MCRIPNKKTEQQQHQGHQQPKKHEDASPPPCSFVHVVGNILLAPAVVVLTPFLRLFTKLISDQIIWRVLGHDYIYNTSWEDPRIDRREFGLTDDDHVLTLASAGIMIDVIDKSVPAANHMNFQGICICVYCHLNCTPLYAFRVRDAPTGAT